MYQRFTESEKRSFVHDYYSQPVGARLSQKAFATKVNTSLSTFTKWIREYSDDNFSYNEEHDPYDTTEPSGFIEVKPAISLESKPEIKPQDMLCSPNNNIVITKHDIKIELPINIGLD